MATYKEIQGTAVQSLASNTGTIEGQIWYDTANNAFKLQTVTTTASWATATSLPVSTDQAAAAGTYLAGIMFGGNSGPSYSNQSLTYDGSSWTATPSLNTATALAGGSGTSTAGLCVGGELQAPSFGDSDRTEEYDGSSWTTVTNRPAVIRNHSLFGLQTAAVSCLGINYTTVSQEYDGTNWSTGGTNNTARRGANDGTGSETTGIVAGGQAPGSPAGITATETYDGSSWTSSPASLPTGKFDCATFGNNLNAISAAGRTPTRLATVVEWIGIGVPTSKTITTT